MSDLPSCDTDIYKNGKVVMIIAGGSEMIEAAVIEASIIGPTMDWYFAGGRAVVKTLGDTCDAFDALNTVLEADKYVDIQR